MSFYVDVYGLDQVNLRAVGYNFRAFKTGVQTTSIGYVHSTEMRISVSLRCSRKEILSVKLLNFVNPTHCSEIDTPRRMSSFRLITTNEFDKQREEIRPV